VEVFGIATKADRTVIARSEIVCDLFSSVVSKHLNAATISYRASCIYRCLLTDTDPVMAMSYCRTGANRIFYADSACRKSAQDNSESQDRSYQQEIGIRTPPKSSCPLLQETGLPRYVLPAMAMVKPNGINDFKNAEKMYLFGIKDQMHKIQARKSKELDQLRAFMPYQKESLKLTKIAKLQLVPADKH